MDRVTVDFGVAPDDWWGHIFGVVFEDVDADGVRDSEESGMAGIEVVLGDYGGGRFGTTTTGDDGSYEFFVSYVDARDAVDGLRVAIPDSFDQVRLWRTNRYGPVEGGSHEINLGLAEAWWDTAAISGSVFDDGDADGLRSDDEHGLPGVTVWVYEWKDGIPGVGRRVTSSPQSPMRKGDT